MKINDIIDAIDLSLVNITSHARQEAKNDSLLLDEIYFTVQNGEIIEDYPKDKPYPSCLILGKLPDGDPIQSVWAFDTESKIAVLITVYRPDPDIWINWKVRKKS